MLAWLQAIAATNKPKEKIALIREAAAKQEHFATVLSYAYNPYKRFFVRRLMKVVPSNRRRAKWGVMFALLEELAARRITGSKAQAAIHDFMQDANAEECEVLKRILHKDLQCGINTKIINSAIARLIPEFKIMLAQTFDPERALWPMYADTKMDGMRAICLMEHGTEWLTRGGRPIRTASHITPYVEALAPAGGMLDGELRAIGENFENSISATKRGSAKEGAEVVFHVFDYLTRDEWKRQKSLREYKERLAKLEDMFQIMKGSYGPLRFSAPPLVETIFEANAAFDVARASGHEGIVLKDPTAIYQFKRSVGWLKMKASESIDVAIGDAEPGEGRFRGMLGAFQFKYRGETCRVGTGFSLPQRKAFWRKRESMRGTIMEVEFTEVTAKGKTRHARFIRLREHEGERT